MPKIRDFYPNYFEFRILSVYDGRCSNLHGDTIFIQAQAMLTGFKFHPNFLGGSISPYNFAKTPQFLSEFRLGKFRGP